MTKQERSKENHRKHKELWNWLAETGNDKKNNCPIWEGEYRPDNFAHCFACKEANSRKKNELLSPLCATCPIKWGGGRSCEGISSEFAKWEDAENTEERKYWAKKIANKRWSKP